MGVGRKKGESKTHILSQALPGLGTMRNKKGPNVVQQSRGASSITRRKSRGVTRKSIAREGKFAEGIS